MPARGLLTVRAEPELIEALDDAARRGGVTRSAAIRAALVAAVDPEVLRAGRQRHRDADVRAGLDADRRRLEEIRERMAARGFER